MSALALFLAGCPAPEPPTTLRLEGPAEVRVETLGVIDGPRAVVERGDTPIADAVVTWTVENPAVANVDGGTVTAAGPGTTAVVANYGEHHAAFTLIVDPPVGIVFIAPPAEVAVGAEALLVVQGHIGEQVIDPGALQWRSSNDAVAAISPDGRVTGVAPGVAYITVDSPRAEAMLELQVVAPK